MVCYVSFVMRRVPLVLALGVRDGSYSSHFGLLNRPMSLFSACMVLFRRISHRPQITQITLLCLANSNAYSLLILTFVHTPETFLDLVSIISWQYDLLLPKHVTNHGLLSCLLLPLV